MKIDQLVLSGCKRLMLNNIQQITFTPSAFYQLILGTNGSGKSSLLEELSPLPANGKHYIKGGYKKIFVSHLGIDYILSSTFKTASGQHSFIRVTGNEHEELNPGGTGQVQKTLVEQIFGITNTIHRLLIGKTKFTSLTPAKRREWITMVCSADYGYAVGVYQKLRSGARDAQGALKHTKQRLYNETAKLEQLSDNNGLEERYQRLHDELSTLFAEQQRDRTPLTELYQRFEVLKKSLDERASWLIKTTAKLQDANRQYGFGSLEAIENALNEVNTEKEVNRALRVKLGKEYQELTDLINELKDNNACDVDDIKKQISGIEKVNQLERGSLESFPVLKAEANAARNAIYEAAEQLMVCLKALPANTDRKFTKQKLEGALSLLDRLRKNKERAANLLAGAERQLHHLESLKQQECPKCSHQWVPGKSDQEVEELVTAIAKHQDTVKQLDEKQKGLESYLEAADGYRSHFNALKRLTQEHPRLVDLWDVIMTDQRLMDDPASLTSVVNQYLREVETHVRLEENNTKLERLHTLLSNTEHTNSGSQGLEKRLAVTQEQLEEITQTLMEVERKESELKRFYKEMRHYLETLEELENLLDESDQLYHDLVEGERQKGITQVVKRHQNELSSLQAKRSEKTTLEGIIRDLEKDHGALEKDQKALALLAKTLSPTDGLIAEQLMGFIENFVQHVNQFIASVWTYELKVKGCGVESGDLDYKFPFSVNDGQGTLDVPDIGEGSEAQLEIINLAFRLVTMIYLKLEEYPLYMDELGRSFDEQHRRNVMDFIKRLTDGANYTQLFMVSHFAAEYGAFTQAEILVLSDSNIAVPQKHNEHVEIL